MKRIIFAAILMASLSACGFHPRGSFAIPESIGAVQVVNSDTYSALTDGLQSAVDRANANKTDTLRATRSISK